MKKQIFLLLSLGAITLTSCQSTPETEYTLNGVVVSKQAFKAIDRNLYSCVKGTSRRTDDKQTSYVVSIESCYSNDK